jgi:hypothetical protein
VIPATARPARFLIACLGTALMASTCTVMAFYSYTKRVSVIESQVLGTLSSGNSIRHAFAAAEAFAILRAIGLPSSYAEKMVVKLGFINEYVENYTKRRQDPTSEVYKDLFNNASGIVAARFSESCTDQGKAVSRLKLITWLAARHSLPYVDTDSQVPATLPGGANVRAAINRFKADKHLIDAEIGRDLAVAHDCSGA